MRLLLFLLALVGYCACVEENPSTIAARKFFERFMTAVKNNDRETLLTMVDDNPAKNPLQLVENVLKNMRNATSFYVRWTSQSNSKVLYCTCEWYENGKRVEELTVITRSLAEPGWRVTSSTMLEQNRTLTGR